MFRIFRILPLPLRMMGLAAVVAHSAAAGFPSCNPSFKRTQQRLSVKMESSNERSQVRRRNRPSMHPCQSCKRLKRRCGRELPECSLCVRTHRQCEYQSTPASTSLPAECQSPQPTWLDTPLNRFPATYFLDRRMFGFYHMTLGNTHLNLSSTALSGLASVKETRQIAEKYFSSIHIWFPIINRARFHGNLLHHSIADDINVGMLILCMQILGSRPTDGTEATDRVYVAVKQSISQLEQAGALNITVLQSLLLIAIYEIGNGIYPAAYLTVGSCARYAMALDLDREILSWSPNASDKVNMEEKHRAWWATLMLDRYLNISCPTRALCTPDPIEQHYLPTRDEDWDEGLNEPPRRLSTPVEIKMGKFARLAQATHLLGLVLRHIREPTRDETFLSEEKDALDRALRSLLSLTVAEETASTETAFCSPIALLGSALLTLQSQPFPYRGSDTLFEKSADLQTPAYRMALEANAQVLVPIARRIRECWPQAPRHPSPLVLDWMYRCMASCKMIHQNEDSFLNEDYAKDVREAMKLLSYDWAVGELYFKLLDM